MTYKDTSSCGRVYGRVAPVVDRNRCEGKEDCVRVCPYGVFSIARISDEDRANLSFKGKIKAWVHGGKQAHVTQPEACHACQLCLDACPEKALSLVPISW